MSSTLPDWISDLAPYADTLIAFGSAPALFIRKRVVSFIVGVVASLASATGAVGRDSLTSVADAIRKAADSFGGAIGGIVGPVVGGWVDLNLMIARASTDLLGPAAPFVIVGVIVLQVALVIRAIPPALVAASDALGAVPVIGSILDAAASFAIEYIGGSNDS
ncbi:hypothetical protein [Haloplanus salinarum]|uniref:hypothetical protein n=1 Tax=Haloplanus salinarum TaxID=1912324 RepID=UPI00214C7C1B|nr:hypothetical protein [Haloplanus salinarum]